MTKRRPVEQRGTRKFDVERYLTAVGADAKPTRYRRGTVVFSQGQPATTVAYIQSGEVKLSVVSHEGREAIVALLGPTDFFGEGALAGQPVRLETATTTTGSCVVVIETGVLARLLHTEPTFSDRFIAYLLTRKLRIEADLVDQLFNSTEKRLARTLLLLARYSDANPPWSLPPIAQGTLAEMVGTTRSRVNGFMSKFRKLGFIEGGSVIRINRSLLTLVVLDLVPPVGGRSDAPSR
ncbi:MAG TPA: Crp/Fnr family transcriptional regulator [Vicinamibacterales bacterium]|nr:Crp/Fnr family transcriptional regulator [Vicinamibacterales bacterium]